MGLVMCTKRQKISPRILIGIKPEHVVITRKPKESSNAFRAKIVKKRFMGKWTNVTLEIKNESDTFQLRTKTPSLFVPKFMHNDVIITAYWDPEHAQIFPYREELNSYLGLD